MIKAGDLVVMIRAPRCGCCIAPMGIPFIVASITGFNRQLFCCNDFAFHTGDGPWANGYSYWRIPLSLLKKIDPPAEDVMDDLLKELTT